MQGRVLAGAALMAAVIAAAYALLGGSDPYELRLRFDNAGQLVKGNVVTVGGLPVGTVSKIALTDANQAEVTIDVTEDRFTPLHRGTRADVRISSLSSVANRTVALEPGPTSEPRLPSGTTIPATATSTPVEIDQVVSTLDQQSRSDLQSLIHGSAELYRGHASDANRTLAALNPAVGQTAGMLDQLARDQAAFRGVIVDTAAIMTTLDQQRAGLDGLLGGASRLTAELASRTASIDGLLRRSPAGVRDLGSLFALYTRTFDRLRPDARLLSAATPQADEAVRRLQPTLRDAVPALADARPLVVSLAEILRGTPGLRRSGVPALERTSSAVAAAMPIVRGALPYFPDVIQGAIGGFGGQTAAGYDANGNYIRIAPEVGTLALEGAQTAAGLVNTGGSGPSRGNVNRCPGGAASADDKTSPFAVEQTGCDPSQTP